MGGEALILEAWLRLAPVGIAADDAKALLVIVPRHPQRLADVAKLARESGYRVQLRSENTVVAGDTDVFIGDSMGEMFAYYASADLAFIGGSLLDFGSQNLIEAAACGTPILIGPSTRNFADAARAAVSCGAARTIVDADELVRQVQELLADDALLQSMGGAGRRFAEHHRGATARTMELLSRATR